MTDTVEVEGADAVQYAARAAKLTGDRRVPRAFMSAREVRSVFDSLIPRPSEPRQSVRISRLSGFPVLEELLRARARSRAAADQHTIERFRADARLRKVMGRDDVLKIVVDRFDPVASVFVRATIELTSHQSREVEVAGDRATLSGALRDTLFRYAGAEPEMLYLRLTGVPDVTVSEVTVGQTGPLYCDLSVVPESLDPAVQLGWVLHCRRTRVGSVVDLDARNDPFATSLESRLGPTDYNQLCDVFSSEYRVFQEASFIAERPAVAALKAQLPRCIVHAVTPPPA